MPAQIKAAIEGVFNAWRKAGNEVVADNARPPKTFMFLLFSNLAAKAVVVAGDTN